MPQAREGREEGHRQQQQRLMLDYIRQCRIEREDSTSSAPSDSLGVASGNLATAAGSLGSGRSTHLTDGGSSSSSRSAIGVLESSHSTGGLSATSGWGRARSSSNERSPFARSSTAFREGALSPASRPKPRRRPPALDAAPIGTRQPHGTGRNSSRSVSTLPVSPLKKTPSAAALLKLRSNRRTS